MNNASKKSLLGVLIDVSGSMKEYYKSVTGEAIEHSKVKRSDHAIDILAKITESSRKDTNNMIFSIAFGVFDEMNSGTPKERNTCDLIFLLEELYMMEENRVEEIKLVLEELKLVGHEPLIQLGIATGAPYCEYYIRNYYNEEESGRIFEYLSTNKRVLRRVVSELPSQCKKKLSQYGTRPISGLFSILTFEYVDPQRDEALKLKQKLFSEISASKTNGIRCAIKFLSQKGLKFHHLEREKNRLQEELNNFQHSSSFNPDQNIRLEEIIGPEVNPRSYTYGEVFSILKETSSKLCDHGELKNGVFNNIEKFIYGYTPLCKSLKFSKSIFNEKNMYADKVLLIISDGDSTDGDPKEISTYLKDQGVKIVSCFITDNSVPFKKKLFDINEFDPKWTQGQIDMFKMSSKISTNNSCGLRHLKHKGWDIPLSGECKLYAHVNNREALEEFTEILKKLSEDDALIDLIGEISLDDYINERNTSLEPVKQIGGTCYAHADFIIGRTVPKFHDIKECLIKRYGKFGADTRGVLEEKCPEYGLKYKQVDEKGAREAIFNNRPCVARFRLCEEEWEKFTFFFENNPKGIIEKKDLIVDKIKPRSQIAGLAVVLIRTSATCLTFMNSWGNNWADKGFFHVRDADVLNLEFFDVYWDSEQLSK